MTNLSENVIIKNCVDQLKNALKWYMPQLEAERLIEKLKESIDGREGQQ